MSRASFRERGYSAEWDRYRKQYLAAHPWCVPCGRVGWKRPAKVVDHIVPHNGDRKKFVDPANHMALCRSCHGIKTATKDGAFNNPKNPSAALRPRVARGCDAQGNPVTPEHHWNASARSPEAPEIDTEKRFGQGGSKKGLDWVGTRKAKMKSGQKSAERDRFSPLQGRK